MNILNGIVNLFRFDKTNWKAVALCLVAATVFWFFNALNKEHTATISFPIEFQYDQTVFIPAKALPQNILLNITGSGWDLLRKSLGFKTTPLLVTLGRPVETLKIPPATILPIAAAQLGETRINHVASDTLFVSIEPRKTKKIKLVTNTKQLRFKEGFGISSTIVILPDSVLAEGPSGTLTKIPDSIQLEFPSIIISENTKEELDISPPKEMITLSPNTAIVMFEVSKQETFRKKVKVVVLPSPPFRSQVMEDSVFVTFRMPSKLKNEMVKSAGLFAVINPRVAKPGITKIIPSIKGIPPFADVVLIDSVVVKKY